MEDFELDPPLTPKEEAMVALLSEAELASIDAQLLSNVGKEWLKVSWVVGVTMSKFPTRKIGLPDLYYSQRVTALVKNGTLESQGFIGRMRYSEVRLPSLLEEPE